MAVLRQKQPVFKVLFSQKVVTPEKFHKFFKWANI